MQLILSYRTGELHLFCLTAFSSACSCKLCQAQCLPRSCLTQGSSREAQLTKPQRFLCSASAQRKETSFSAPCLPAVLLGPAVPMPLVNGRMSASTVMWWIGAHHTCYPGCHQAPSLNEVVCNNTPAPLMFLLTNLRWKIWRKPALLQERPNSPHTGTLALAMAPARNLPPSLTSHNWNSCELFEFGLTGFSWRLVRYHGTFCTNDRCCNLGNATVLDCSLPCLSMKSF